MDEKIKRIKTWLSGGKAPPFVLEIRPTNNCNLNCLSCQARGKEQFIPEEENISNEQYTNLIHDAGKFGVRFVQIVGGGEPLVRKDATFLMMKTIKQHNIGGFLVTNGTLFTEDMVKTLVEIGFDSIFFSIDGPNKETNDFLRGKGSFDKSMNSLKLFASWKRKLNKDKPRITLGPVLSNKNFDKIDGFVRLAHDLRIEEVTLQPIMVPDNSLGKILKLSEEQKKECKIHLEKAVSLANRYNVNTNFKGIDSDLIEQSTEIENVIKEDFKKERHKFLSTPCYEPFFFISVHANGKAYPCCIDDNTLDFGNIKEKSLENIWYGKCFDAFRKNLLNKNLGPKCKECCGTLVMENREIRNKLAS